MNEVTTSESDTEAAGPDGQSIDPALTERHPLLTEEEADELRSQLRCGRTLPPVHLLEGDYVASRGNWYRPTYHALCCAEVDSDSSESVRFDHDAMSGEDYCPGC
ncbi:MAG: hypothetical protein ACRDR6_31365, partial [Pseudonocardiaceae bacterium]